MKIRTYKEAMNHIFTFEQGDRDYSLEKVEKAIKLLNNPLKGIKVIHVAGTNGKGSVCKMIFSVLKNAGKKVGVFTSPHLIDIRERFDSSEGQISEENFVKFTNELIELPFKLSYFEKCTLIAFLFFEEIKVEFAIIEVGCGGLLDSTNVVNPVITAITSISIDHVSLLGTTFDEISFQKAGIIKENIPVVFNHKNKVIEGIAKQRNAPIIFINKKNKTNLVGDFQEKNAGIAFEICKLALTLSPSPLGEKEVTQLILDGLQEVKHLGRMQYLTPNLLIDGAHNEVGLLELKKYLLNLGFNKNICRGDCGIPNNIKLCFAQKKGKNGENILKVFGENNYILIQSKNELIVEEAENLKKEISLLTEGFSPLLKSENITNNFEIKTSEEIFELAKNNKNNLYVVFGSLYMIGDFYV